MPLNQILRRKKKSKSTNDNHNAFHIVHENELIAQCYTDIAHCQDSTIQAHKQDWRPRLMTETSSLKSMVEMVRPG